eukprot:CAMPEP_0201154114 /NCGR_PEP_ID=MMETSP0851-20130426/14377_1 /ASSEMBLY_ACC=CAM_ASM_000631 /TAXON_ID=183588 /ORGANISM="Pseudo-nitzschia fraudulenta, Strain WWA7" /LENGTH=873 /DNA_ID=CAMNT_0047431429 /DNA_START=290 /DNA_END=2908 /DNA_ORIENTATION=+
MAVSLLDDDDNSGVAVVTVDNVGIYTGMLGAAFTFGRFLGFVPWKIARNLLGEKNALILSLLLTGLASLRVGLATTFKGALVARLVQGVSNCISGSVKRGAINATHNMMSERSASSNGSSKPPEDIGDANPQAPILSVMWWGTALGPVVGGLLSDPGFLGSYFGLDSASEWYSRYPYLLSNAFSALLCWLSMLCVAIFTNEQPQDSISGSLGEKRPLLGPPSGSVRSVVKTTAPRLWKSFSKLWTLNKDARYHLIAYWSFSFVVVCYDEALPLFLITSKESTGMGLSEGRVGLLLSATGLIVAIAHHSALDNFFDIENGAKGGMYRILGACAFLGNVPAALIPLSLILNTYDYGGIDSNEASLLGLNRWAFLYLVVLVSFLRGAASLYFSLIGMATGRTLRVVHKDEAARIMTIGALLVRSFAPLVAGALLSLLMAPSSSSWTSTLSPLHSSWMVWIVIGIVFGLSSATISLILARGRMSQIELKTEKRRSYIEDRVSMTGPVSESWEEYYGSATKSIRSRWDDFVNSRICWANGDAPSGETRMSARRSVRMSRMSSRRSARMSASSIAGNSQDKAMEDARAALKHAKSWRGHIVKPGVDFDTVSFFIIGTHKKDTPCVPHVLVPTVMDALQEHLPMHCAESNFWLRYSLLRDGASMHSMEAKSGLSKYTILAIETLNGDVFGCFMTKPWVSTNNKYRRSVESFLWKLTNRRSARPQTKDEEAPELEGTDSNIDEYDDDIIDVYRWSGDNDLCQLFADDKIAVGGGVVGHSGDGFGILLEDDLLSGSSSPCATYNNPSLCISSTDGVADPSLSARSNTSSTRDETRFEVANMEIWGLTPFLFVADAERSEKSLRFAKDNSYTEGDTPSSTTPW